MANSNAYRVCCRGFRPMLWTIAIVLTANLIYRGLLLLDGQGTLKKHGFNFTIPKLAMRYKKPPTAAVPVSYLLDNSFYCSTKPQLIAVALIPSKVPDFEARQETRQTWGSANEEGSLIGKVFLVGLTKTKEQRQALRKESLKYNDIVQGEYEDDLEASKLLNGLVWMALHCHDVPFTIIASDKIVLDVYLLQSLLYDNLSVKQDQNGLLYGNVVYPEPVLEEEDMDQSNSWSLGHLIPEVTDAPLALAPFLREEAWFGTTKAVLKLLSATKEVPVVDPLGQYMTGQLARAAGLILTPRDFNEWWSTDGNINTYEVGLILGWISPNYTISRPQLWKLIKEHHMKKLKAFKEAEMLSNATGFDSMPTKPTITTKYKKSIPDEEYLEKQKQSLIQQLKKLKTTSTMKPSKNVDRNVKKKKKITKKKLHEGSVSSSTYSTVKKTNSSKKFISRNHLQKKQAVEINPP